MTPDPSLTPEPAAPRRRIRVRTKKRRHGIWRLLHNLWVPLCVLGVVASYFGIRYIASLRYAGEIVGYISNPVVLTQEYWRFEGKSLRDAAAQQQFDQASELVRKSDVHGAVMVLESISRTCAEPMIFHDIGLLYARMEDHKAAVNAFREALARDPNYGPTLTSLSTLPGFSPREADPIVSESEPNGTYLTANLISLNTLVAGAISSQGDVDFFRFSAPQAPRDVVRIEIAPQEQSLVPRLTIYDDTGHPTGETAGTPDAGTSLVLLISPKPNSTLYLEVAGDRGTTGRYVLRLTPTHSFDRFEANEDFASAYSIAVGQTLDANIMTAEDLDFYSFMPETSGEVTITLQNRSKTLIPAMTVFGPDRQAIQRADERIEAGGKFSLSIKALEHQVYYVEVWGQSKSAGNYTLAVQ